MKNTMYEVKERIAETTKPEKVRKKMVDSNKIMFAADYVITVGDKKILVETSDYLPYGEKE